MFHDDEKECGNVVRNDYEKVICTRRKLSVKEKTIKRPIDLIKLPLHYIVGVCIFTIIPVQADNLLCTYKPNPIHRMSKNIVFSV